MADDRFFREDPYVTFCKELAPTKKPAHDLRARMDTGEAKEVTRLKGEFDNRVNEFFSRAQIPLVSEHKVHDMSELLNNSFIVGESHNQTAAKKFLIDNMKAFRVAGYTTLYFEHLYYDEQGLLDDYSRTGIMSKKLKYRLDMLDIGNSAPSGEDQDVKREVWKKYNFTAIIQAARDAGIRVVGIDVKAVYESQVIAQNDPNDNMREAAKRMRYMNYTAFQIIQREESMKPSDERKWLALMGNMHVNYQHSTPGVADLLRVTSIYAFDNEAKENHIPVNVEYRGRHLLDRYILSGDVMLSIRPEAASPRYEILPANELMFKGKGNIS